MEEKENLEKGIRKVGKAAKKILRNPILRKAVIVLAVFVIIIIALGSAYDALMDAFSKNVSEHVQNTPVKYNQTDYSINIEDETVQGLIKMMEQKGIKVANLGLKEEDIKKIYAAEVVSSEINLNVRKVNGKDEFTKQDPKKYYGRVFIEREGANGNLERLKYVPDINEFKQMSSPGILECFSIDEEGKLCVASTYEKTDGSGNGESSIDFNTLNLKDDIAQYTVPVEFLLDLCVITQNPGFVLEFADKIINETEIVIQILQDKTVTKTVETLTYDVKSSGEITTERNGYNSSSNQRIDGVDTLPIDENTNAGTPETTTEIETRISSRIRIKSVENWIMKEVYTYNKVGPTETENDLDPEILEDGEATTETDTKSQTSRWRHNNYNYCNHYTKDKSKN